MSSLITNEINILPSQFKVRGDGGNTNLNKLLTAFLLPFQQFSDNITDSDNALLDIEKSKGKQLDILGKLIDALRESLSDDDFRLYIKLKTKLNNADGTADFTIFAIDKTLNTNQYFYTEGEQEVILYLNLKAELTEKQLKILRNTIAAGIRLKIYYTLNDQIYVLSEVLVPFLIEDGIEGFLIGDENFPDEFLISDLAGNGSGDLESATFARGFAIGNGDEDFLIGNGGESFLVTRFDEV